MVRLGPFRPKTNVSKAENGRSMAIPVVAAIKSAFWQRAVEVRLRRRQDQKSGGDEGNSN